MAKMIFLNKKGEEVEVDAKKREDGSIVLSKDGSVNTVTILPVPIEKIEYIRDLVVTREEEKRILGPVLFNMVNKIRSK